MQSEHPEGLDALVEAPEVLVLPLPVIEVVMLPIPLMTEFPATNIAAIPAMPMTTMTTPIVNDLESPFFCKLQATLAVNQFKRFVMRDSYSKSQGAPD